MKIDAHCHTDCSDGNLTIEERLALIRAVGLQAATITDHDFVSAEQVSRAQRAAGDMPFIPGIELSLAHQGMPVHMLGYYVDPADPPLQEHIRAAQGVDRECTLRFLEQLDRQGRRYAIDDFISPSLHTFYSLRMVKRVAHDLFGDDPKRMLSYFLERVELAGLTYADFSPWSVRDGIDLIHGAGGFCVLAHPGGQADPAMRRLGFLLHAEVDVRRYVDWGLDGVEVASPVHTAEEKVLYTAIAARLGLLTTAGSDCHGDDPFLGPALMGKFTDIPDDLYERMMDFHVGMQRRRVKA